MADQTFAELTTTLKALVDLLEEVERFGRVNAENFLALQEALNSTLDKSDFGSTIRGGVGQMRADINRAITSSARVAFDAHLLDFARFLGTKESDPPSILRDLQDHFDDSAETVQERDFAFGTPVSSGPVGDTLLQRQNTDRFGQDIESQFAEDKTAEVTQDQNGGRRPGQELWRFEGERFVDDVELEAEGSGLVLEVPARHPSFGLLQNPSFDVVSGADATPDSVQGWTWSGTESTDLERVTADFFLPALTPTLTPSSLKVKTNGTLSQAIALRTTALDFDAPHRFRVGVKLSGATGGTITLHQGSSSQAFTVAALPAGFSYISMDLDKDLWPDNFNELALDIKIVISGLVGGDLLFDDAFFGPLVNFGGGWYDILPGAVSSLKEAKFSFTDSIATDGKIQKWFSRLYRVHLKHAPAATPPTVTDP